jgi:NAD(P)-dependent dehydrogenase (short-subunit alcohol dehydrogenase family)
VAVITGGASGIGRAAAELMAEEGAAVVVADWTAEEGEQVAAGVRSRGGRALLVRADVSVAAEAARIAQEAVAAFGGIDVLVNGAAIPMRDRTVETTDEPDWERVMGVNLKSVYLVSKHVVPTYAPAAAARS